MPDNPQGLAFWITLGVLLLYAAAVLINQTWGGFDDD